MGQLVLVRHAQASFFGASYDELSALGREQAAALGEHWARHGVAYDRVYVGPRRRHRQTYDLVAAAYRERGLPWRALDALCVEPQARVCAFTSGGFVCAATGWLLGLDDDRIVDLSLVLRNTALTEVSYSARRRNLVSFNALPHLADPRFATAV